MGILNLTQYIIQKNQHCSNKTALIYIESPDEIFSFTYKEVFERVEIIANFFIKLKKHTPYPRVLLRLPSNPNVVFYFFGCILAGFIPIPVSRMLTREEVDFLIQDSQAKYIVYEELELPSISSDIKVFHASKLLDELWNSHYGIRNSFLDTDSEEPAFMIYTSGTTGRQKGVIHPHRNILGRIPIQREWLDIHDSDILLHAGELNWTYTLGVGIMDVWANSGTSILVGKARKDISIWTWIMNHFPVSIFTAVPGLYRRILKYTSNELLHLPYIRHFLTAGESLSSFLWQDWTRITQKPLYEALGMTEISTYISSGPRVPTRPGSPGKPQKGRQVAIIPIDSNDTKPLSYGKVGFIAVHKKDPGLMLGYHNRPEEEKLVYRGEWFIGGDLAYQDPEGYIWFQGRNNDLMNSFGYRVSPLEIEKVLEQHPHIQESCVMEIQKNKEISFITAFVVTKSFRSLKSSLKEEDIISYCKEHLAFYKCPRKVVFLQELPRNLSGKILKQKLKQEFDYKI